MGTEIWEELGTDKAWECYDGTSSETEMGQLLYGLIRMLKPKLVIETGCYLGYSTLPMALAVGENRYGRMISIDTEANCVGPARKRCQYISASILEIRQGDVAKDLWELEDADFIFSDSGYQMRKEEMRRAKKGAVVVVHDTRMSFDGSSPAGYLGELVRLHGGLTFLAGRGFGVFIK